MGTYLGGKGKIIVRDVDAVVVVAAIVDANGGGAVQQLSNSPTTQTRFLNDPDHAAAEFSVTR